MQHAESELRNDRCIRYYSYLTLESRDLPDPAAFAYVVSIALGSKKAAVFLERGLDQQKSDSEGDVVMRGGTKKKSDSKGSKSKLSAVMLVAGNVPDVD